MPVKPKKLFTADTPVLPVAKQGGQYIHKKDYFINAVRRCKSLKSPSALLDYLIQHRAWKDKRDKHNTWYNFYVDKKLIVASRSQERMAADLGVGVATIKRWLYRLSNDGLVMIIPDGRENVYAIGDIRWDDEKGSYYKHYFYYDE